MEKHEILLYTGIALLVLGAIILFVGVLLMHYSIDLKYINTTL